MTRYTIIAASFAVGLGMMAIADRVVPAAATELTWAEPFLIPGTDKVLKADMSAVPEGESGKVLCYSRVEPPVRRLLGYHRGHPVWGYVRAYQWTPKSEVQDRC
jgi:hypothetical protein